MESFESFSDPLQPTDDQPQKSATFCKHSGDLCPDQHRDELPTNKSAKGENKKKTTLNLKYCQSDLQEQLNYFVGETLRAEARVNKLYQKGQMRLQEQYRVISNALNEVDSRISSVMAPDIHDL